MPCPGPQLMRSIQILVEPAPREIQSSPVLIDELWIVTPLDIWMWMPSVFGLFSGAIMFIPCNVTPVLPKITM